LTVGFNSSDGKETFYCHQQSCGIHGDIYDAVEILEGITDKKEQFNFLEKLFGIGLTPFPVFIGNKKEFKNFTADPDAQKKLETYLLKNINAEKEIIKFLNLRAVSSSLGLVQKYPGYLFPSMVKNFFYWPGLPAALRDLGAETLRCAGIPLKNPNTKIAWWEHPGVILKLGKGYKLHYYVEGDCKKFGSKCSSTFPMPGEINKSKPVILVEGEMDAVSAVAAGIENLFATGGTSGLTGPKIKEYLLDVSEIIICFDADDSGRKASGLIAYDPTDNKKTNIPEIMRNSGYNGIIKIAELPLTENEKDADALIISGKRDIVIKAIQEAREYVPPEKKIDERTPLKWDYLSINRIQSILKKITKNLIEEKEQGDIQLFISAILKTVKNQKIIESDLLKWGATKEQIKNKVDITPYILIEFAWKYGLSEYLQRTLKVELTPAGELMKRINRHKPIVNIDFEEIKLNKNILQFLETLGVRVAALIISDILDGRIIYIESENNYYFFNGHVWQREPDMTGVIYNIIIAIMLYFYENIDLKEFGLKKSDIDKIIVKIESRNFRVDIMKEFSQLKQFGVFKTSVLFDGPAIRETLTLIDGVADFSGKELNYRKSEKEEYRRDVLPYTIENLKNTLNPYNFIKFNNGNFTDKKTLETLLYYLSLIISRNTKFKYGGIFIGETNTGKTTTMDIMQAVLPNMIKTIPSEILVSKGGSKKTSGNEATPYISALEGKGCGLSSETGRNLYLNTALWKQLTGGDIMPTRNLYEKAREFESVAQILILTNYLPLFDGHDGAAIGRLIIVPFLIQHKRGDKNTINIDIFKKLLIPEYPGIIKLLIEYYLRLKNELNGEIPLSDDCKKYRKSYLKELDTDIDAFVKQRIKFDVSDDAFVKVQDVYDCYLKFYNLTSSDSGKDALTRHKFTRYFKKDYQIVDYKQKKVKGIVDTYFLNVRIIPDAELSEDFEENEPSKMITPAPPPEDDPF